MKRLNLGRALALLFVPYMLFAGVKATLDRVLIYKGDQATLTITAEGNDVKFPQIDEIAGFNILGTSSSQSVTSINGNTTRSISKSFAFAPTKSINIPPFEVVVDGKKLKTNPLNIKVTKPSAMPKDAPVQLEMRLEKKEAYVGEPVRLDLIFKQHPQTRFDKVELSQPELKGFWVKKLPDAIQSTEDGYITQTYSYILFAQQEGKFNIPAIFARVGTIKRGRRFNDPFFDDPFFSSFSSQMQWQKIFSNESKLIVKPLPESLEVYGDFTINAHVDKIKVNANKPVNFTIIIKGEGNLDDISKFDLDIDGAVIYSDEPIVEASIVNGRYMGVFKQKIAIVADTNYTIEPIKFTYFDKKRNLAKTIETKPFDITVKGSKIKKNETIQTNQIEQKIENSPVVENTTITKSNSNQKYIWLFIGFISGIILTLLGFILKDRFKKVKPKKEIDIITQIERAKDDKTLFSILLPYANESKLIKDVLSKLEQNIYKNSQFKIDKEELIEFFEDLN